MLNTFVKTPPLPQHVIKEEKHIWMSHFLLFARQFLFSFPYHDPIVSPLLLSVLCLNQMGQQHFQASSVAQGTGFVLDKQWTLQLLGNQVGNSCKSTLWQRLWCHPGFTWGATTLTSPYSKPGPNGEAVGKQWQREIHCDHLSFPSPRWMWAVFYHL